MMYQVVKEIKGVHPIHTDYPLLPEDILIEQDDGTFFKTALGLGIYGFTLTPEQLAEHCKSIDEAPPIEIVGMDEYIDWLGRR